MHIRLLLLLRTTTPPALPRLSCGHTFESAHAANCTFDQLVKAWLPPSCPRYGLSEYLEAAASSSSKNNQSGNFNNFPYWHDQTQQNPITDLSSIAADFEVGAKYWTTGREHMTHCTWMLIRLAYVYTTPGQRHDLLVSNFDHAKHCALFMLDRALEGPDVDVVRTVGNVVFGSC
ncbi:hypothetical protein GGS20DRAFT_545314 [Poronia punctata]|nr:hypothetical protein GGS20DRAFT_545314 [Poronia punctata]